MSAETPTTSSSAVKKRGRGRISNIAAAALKKQEELQHAATAQLNNEMLKTASFDVCNVNEHPLKIGCYIMVRYRDGSDRLAKIIERLEVKLPKSDSTIPWKYYIHYNDFNRRMDEWITPDRILSISNVAPGTLDTHGGSIQLSTSVGSTLNEMDTSQADDNDGSVFSGSHHASAKDDEVVNKVQRTSSQPVLHRSTTMVSTIAELDHDEHEGMDEASLLEHEEVTKVKNIQNVQLGKYLMECWYFSPFPKEYYPGGTIDCLYFCEFSFRFFCTKEELIRYQSKPALPHYPPGNEIYRDASVSMFELDGAVEKVYCQNLCYFAKLFLDHKTLYWDVDPFLFYVLCTRDDKGFHPVGYFSKEKYSESGYNLACILTFPCVQRKGYGKILIAFSYELSKKEEKAGSPEKPLSDLGALGYRSYWASVLLRHIRQYIVDGNSGEGLSIMDLSRATSIFSDDIVSTLQLLGLLRYNEAEEAHYIFAPLSVIDTLQQQYPDNALVVDPDKLHWAPLYVTDPKKDKWSFKSKIKSSTNAGAGKSGGSSSGSKAGSNKAGSSSSSSSAGSAGVETDTQRD